MSTRFINSLIATALLLAAVSPALAQQTPWPQAQPEDVSTAPAVVKASYAAISSPAGQPINLDRFRSLFSPDAQLISIKLHGNQADARRMTVNEFVEVVKQSIGRDGHTEREIAERIESYGNMATVWSTYESGKTRNDPHAVRGVNSIQLMNDGKRWWITGAQWEHETPETPIPEKYLSGGQ